MPPPQSSLLDLNNRASVYDNLYAKKNYHADLRHSLSVLLISHVVARHYGAAVRPRTRVLDVGCSHGLGVQKLWDLGFRASGVDIAQSAVDIATRHRKPKLASSPPRDRRGAPVVADQVRVDGRLELRSADADAALRRAVFQQSLNLDGVQPHGASGGHAWARVGPLASP